MQHWVLLGATATAQTPSEQASSGLQEVVITGSLIKRTDAETPSPVQVISDKDLQNSGFNNVVDVLHNLAANGQGTLNQGFGQAFASGGSGIALRGLTVGNTLTLIDGERMVAYPLSDDGERSFVDVSATGACSTWPGLTVPRVSRATPAIRSSARWRPSPGTRVRRPSRCRRTTPARSASSTRRWATTPA